MKNVAAAQTPPVDWDWANERLTLEIFNAAALSLGYEINSLAPIDHSWAKGAFIQPPEDYKQRVSATYEAVRMGALSCRTTTQKGATFDITASFSEAQFWEVSTVEFRHFCDDRGWIVPEKFIPNGYASAAPGSTPAPRGGSSTTHDLSMLATRNQLIDAFGSFTGMDKSWFKNLTDSPALLAARKVPGQGGRGYIAEPFFCPLEVMQWLTSPKRRKGRQLGPDKAWELLEKHFPKVHCKHSIADPRDID